MTCRPLFRAKGIIAATVLVALAGCGGGGGSSSGPAPGPVASGPAPSPTPVPAPGAFSIAQSPFGLQQTQATQFHVLGIAFRATGGAWEDVADPATFDGAQPLGVRLVTTSDLRLAIGGLGEATMVPNGGGGVSPDGKIVALSFNAFGGSGSLSVLYGPEVIPLSSTAFLSHSRVSRASNDPFPLDNIMLVYGVPTPAAAVPSAGVERYGGPSATDAVEIDFATGRVTGQLQTEGGAIDIVDASLLPDRTGFAGRVRGGGGQIDAAIEARFTGAGAREIMYRWIHPLRSGKPAGVGALLRR